MDLSERGDGVVRHPWEVVRGKFFCRLVAELGLTSPVRVLDVGAGDGWLSTQITRVLPAGSTVVCLDTNYTDRDLEEDERRVRQVGGATFDLLLMLDVLEHVSDDENFLSDAVQSSMRPGATAVMSVPAHPWVTSSHDVALEHQRRYRPQDVRALVRRHLRLRCEGSLFLSLLGVRALQRVGEMVREPRGRSGVGEWSGGTQVTRLLTGALAFDADLGIALGRRGLHMPGLSYWAVADRLPWRADGEPTDGVGTIRTS